MNHCIYTAVSVLHSMMPRLASTYRNTPIMLNDLFNLSVRKVTLPSDPYWAKSFSSPALPHQHRLIRLSMAHTQVLPGGFLNITSALHMSSLTTVTMVGSSLMACPVPFPPGR